MSFVMVKQTRWVERTFTFGIPTGRFPSILERFRGTPVRLEEAVQHLAPEILTKRIEGKWSIQEHAGHLRDLEELGEKRLTEFLSGNKILTAADMTNRKTEDAHHNDQSLQVILNGFRNERMSLVRRLEKLTDDETGRSALHPRLGEQMTLVDWLFFMCEHDDHHLAWIAAMKRTFSR